MRVTKTITVDLNSILVAQNLARIRGLPLKKHTVVLSEWVDGMAARQAKRNPKLKAGTVAVA